MSSLVLGLIMGSWARDAAGVFERRRLAPAAGLSAGSPMVRVKDSNRRVRLFRTRSRGCRRRNKSQDIPFSSEDTPQFDLQQVYSNCCFRD